MNHPIRLVAASAQRILERAGLPSSQAVIVADSLIDADLHGHPSHGLSLLPLYLQRIREGGIRRDAIPEWVAVNRTIAVLDAHGAAGQVAAHLGAERCAEVASQEGLAAVAVRNNNHIGMLAAYRNHFQRAGVVGLISNVSGPSVTPPGGVRATIGNNALCLVVPQAGPQPFVIDLATGIVACGKIRDLAAKGQDIPTGWLVDPCGRPSRDPHQLDEGGAVPVFGGHKGLCVSLIVEILAGVLGGHVTSVHVNRQRVHPARVMQCSQLYIGLAPHAFGVGPLDPYIETLAHAVRAGYDSPPPVYFPNQPEAAARLRGDTIDLRPETAALLDFGDAL